MFLILDDINAPVRSSVVKHRLYCDWIAGGPVGMNGRSKKVPKNGHGYI